MACAVAWVVIEVSLPFSLRRSIFTTPRQLSCVDAAMQAKLNLFSATARDVATPKAD
jgi:hypothetical protein